MSDTPSGNSGDLNSGDLNSGNRNSGDLNSGDLNSGNRNSGDLNSGDLNSGDLNSGDLNSGNRNSGDLNSGDLNSGDLNSGNRNSGYLNTLTPSPTFFDLPWDGTWEQAEQLVPYVELPVCCEWVDISAMTDPEKAEFPFHATLGGYLKSQPMPLNESFPLAWAKMDDEDKQRWLTLPNFDADKFLTITGVDVRQPVEAVPAEYIPMKEPRIITLDGVEYELVPYVRF